MAHKVEKSAPQQHHRNLLAVECKVPRKRGVGSHRARSTASNRRSKGDRAPSDGQGGNASISEPREVGIFRDRPSRDKQDLMVTTVSPHTDAMYAISSLGGWCLSESGGKSNRLYASSKPSSTFISRTTQIQSSTPANTITPPTQLHNAEMATTRIHIAIAPSHAEQQATENLSTVPRRLGQLFEAQGKKKAQYVLEKPGKRRQHAPRGLKKAGAAPSRESTAEAHYRCMWEYAQSAEAEAETYASERAARKAAASGDEDGTSEGMMSEDELEAAEWAGRVDWN
ncbi:hypothetical protein LTR53_016912 [Teratosphaeriaceae sp. CCFEE 6253]|nr:hypothetical protein LTR53_016912 [Teratosphaeriaceae sp. CCFEE 6253]